MGQRRGRVARVRRVRGLDGVVRIHSVKTGAAAFSWTLPKGPDGSPFVIYALSFSPGGRHLAVASSDGKVRIVEPLSGREVVVIDDPSRHPYKAAYFPDGRSLAVGGIDGYIRLYRMEDGKKVGEVKAHADAIQAMAVSANGKTVVTGAGYAGPGFPPVWRRAPARSPADRPQGHRDGGRIRAGTGGNRGRRQGRKGEAVEPCAGDGRRKTVRRPAGKNLSARLRR